jgi:hypothetical protein
MEPQVDQSFLDSSMEMEEEQGVKDFASTYLVSDSEEETTNLRTEGKFFPFFVKKKG